MRQDPAPSGTKSLGLAPWYRDACMRLMVKMTVVPIIVKNPIENVPLQQVYGIQQVELLHLPSSVTLWFIMYLYTSSELLLLLIATRDLPVCGWSTVACCSCVLKCCVKKVPNCGNGPCRKQESCEVLTKDEEWRMIFAYSDLVTNWWTDAIAWLNIL